MLTIQVSACNHGNNSHGLSVSEINRILGPSDGSDDERGSRRGTSAPKKVSYNISFSTNCILTYLLVALPKFSPEPWFEPEPSELNSKFSSGSGSGSVNC